MSNVFVVNKVNFMDKINYSKINIKRGKTTFITGVSGSGKSTLCRLLNSTLPFKSGKIYYNNVDIETIDTIELRKNVIFAAQSMYLFDDTIEKNFINFYEYRNLPKPNQQTMNKFLKICLAEFPLAMLCTNMSGGERQRVYIAIFLSFMPNVLILDEPTSALDASSAQSFLSNVKNFCNNNQITLIIISHDKTLIEKYADDVIMLESGE